MFGTYVNDSTPTEEDSGGTIVRRSAIELAASLRQPELYHMEAENGNGTL